MELIGYLIDNFFLEIAFCVTVVLIAPFLKSRKKERPSRSDRLSSRTSEYYSTENNDL